MSNKDNEPLPIQRCINCDLLPKQHINKRTKDFSLKCPNCKIKTSEYKTFDLALSEWNSVHIK